MKHYFLSDFAIAFNSPLIMHSEHIVSLHRKFKDTLMFILQNINEEDLLNQRLFLELDILLPRIIEHFLKPISNLFDVLLSYLICNKI